MKHDSRVEEATSMLREAQTNKRQDIEAKESETIEAQLLLNMQEAELNRQNEMGSMKNEDERSAILTLQQRMNFEIEKSRDLQSLRS